MSEPTGGHELQLDKYFSAIERAHITEDAGKVTHVVGNVMTGYLPGAALGSVCEVQPHSGFEKFKAEVIGFRDRNVLLMPLGEMRGVGLGSRLVMLKPMATVRTGEALLGRVIDGLGEPLDGKGPIEAFEERSIYSAVGNPLDREPIRTPMDLGVRAINGLLTVGQGQRVGIMAGSGVGKSVLLGMLARNATSDVNVIAMIGERGREVKEFVEDILGEEGLKRSILVVATSDQSPLLRMRGAFVATTIAEWFRDRGSNVLLMMDSVTRFAMAQREIGLSAGEPPASKGYTPSVFAQLPKMLERAGSYSGKGSVTGLYTVLVEGDDMDDPIADSVRSIVDGHVVLTRSLAQKGHFPAIDVLQSTSRVMRAVVSSDHSRLARDVRECLATYREAEDLINIGAYKPGANPSIDRAVQLHSGLEAFLRQDVGESDSIDTCVRRMSDVLG